MDLYIVELQAALLNLHGVSSTYVETVPVIEEFEGEIIWQGEVEVFDIDGHPKAKRAYAWGHVTGEEDQGRRYLTVLELPPVNSPATAVQAAIRWEIQNTKQKTKGQTA